MGTRGMVACSQTLATGVGLEILRKGGTAADAAVAVAAALNVCEPTSTGIGGDAFALYYDAKTKKVSAIQGGGASPAALTLDLCRARGHLGTEMIPSTDALCVVVPGAAATWEDVIHRHGSGTLTMADILQPAIELAEIGPRSPPSTAHLWKQQEDLLRAAGAACMLTADGRAPAAGERKPNPELAATFRRLAKYGAREGFYTGPIAEAIVDAVTSGGGVLTLDDLASHVTAFPEPVSTVYRGAVEVWEIPPEPRYRRASRAECVGANSERSHGGGCHRSNARVGGGDAGRFRRRDGTLRRPDAPGRGGGEMHRGGAHLESLRQGSRRGRGYTSGRAVSRSRAGAPRSFASTESRHGLLLRRRRGRKRVFVHQQQLRRLRHRHRPRGCGFTLQNRGHNFILQEGHVNCVGPRKRPYHTIIPGMATRVNDGELFCAFGVMGGFMQPQGHLQVISSMVDLGLDPQAALDQPRWCLGGVGSERGAGSVLDATVAVERSPGESPWDVADRLEAMGHPVERVEGLKRTVFGRGQVIARDENGVLWGEATRGGMDARSDTDPHETETRGRTDAGYGVPRRYSGTISYETRDYTGSTHGVVGGGNRHPISQFR